MQRAMSLNRYMYVQGSVTNAVDPAGMADDPCAQHLYHDGYLYARCLQDNGRKPCPDGYAIHSAREYEKGKYDPYCVVGAGGDFAGQMWEKKWKDAQDPLGNVQLWIAAQEAQRFGLPVEFVASVLAADINYDTGFFSFFYNTVVDVFGLGTKIPGTGISVGCTLILSAAHDYLGVANWESWKHGRGISAGLGNVHAGTARDAEKYFAYYYPGQNLLPKYIGTFDQQNAQRLITLRSDEGAIRYTAGVLRQFADYRTKIRGAHWDLTDDEMGTVFIRYHCDPECFGDESGYENGNSPTCCTEYKKQLLPFLSYYRQRIHGKFGLGPF